MSKRTTWIITFLSITGLALAAELVAALDRDPDTVPWTDLIVAHIPGEVTAAAIGGLSLWLAVHFARRYRSKQ